jgi:hypothetical protein
VSACQIVGPPCRILVIATARRSRAHERKVVRHVWNHEDQARLVDRRTDPQVRPEEFITHALEKELAKLEDAQDEEEIKKRLKGLGYMS